jgi:DNA-binding CsgD family transcriptional regulator
MTSASDLAYWLDVTADLLQRSLTEFPAAALAAHLNHSFELTSLSWEWRETEDDFGVVQFAGATITPGLLEDFHSEQVMPRHLPMRWSAATDPRPKSVGRIPKAAVTARDPDWFRENLVPYRCEQQLSIPYRIQGVSHGAFVLTSANEEFSPDEVDLARRLQRLFAGLYVQVRAQGGAGGLVPSGSVAQVGLTGTEVAVLSLLAQGYPARGIARRLSTSPRTVHKHLEHIYRKLGVTDRLMAVRVATEMGFGPGRGFGPDAAKNSVAVLGHGGPHSA